MIPHIRPLAEAGISTRAAYKKTFIPYVLIEKDSNLSLNNSLNVLLIAVKNDNYELYTKAGFSSATPYDVSCIIKYLKRQASEISTIMKNPIMDSDAFKKVEITKVHDDSKELEKLSNYAGEDIELAIRYRQSDEMD